MNDEKIYVLVHYDIETGRYALLSYYENEEEANIALKKIREEFKTKFVSHDIFEVERGETD